MKKCFILLFAALFLFAAYPAAFAEPTALPDPEASPSAHPAALPSASPQASASTLISYGSTGEMVVRIQLRLRELGYFDYKPTGNFQSMTVEATKNFSKTRRMPTASPSSRTAQSENSPARFCLTTTPSVWISRLPFQLANSFPAQPA